MLKARAWVSSASIFGSFSTLDASSQHPWGYDTKRPGREANKSLRNGDARGKEWTSLDPFQEPMLAQEGNMELQRLADSYEREF